LSRIAKTAAYLAIVALPHRWILRSRTRFVVVMALLCGAFTFRFLSLMLEIISSPGSQTEVDMRLWEWLFSLLMLLLYAVFYAAAPVSLYLSWKYGRKGCLKSSGPKMMLNEGQ
jgi:hypothetical protein